MEYLAHNASFHSAVDDAPSKPGVKHNGCNGQPLYFAYGQVDMSVVYDLSKHLPLSVNALTQNNVKEFTCSRILEQAFAYRPTGPRYLVGLRAKI